LSEAPVIDWPRGILLFAILHLLVYPSSNGYNSYMDRDETPIGGLARPLQPTKQLFYASIVMDGFAVILAAFLGIITALGILIYIAASRAYSYRGIRLKKFPLTGFLTVFVFQGAFIFLLAYYTVAGATAPPTPVLIASLLIGALYPLTQVYQHEEDLKDGVQTISYLLGKRGSFVFSGLLFGAATLLLYRHFSFREEPNYFRLYLLILLPVVLFFLYWTVKVWKNENEADFRHSLRMNLLSTICTTAYFLTLIILKH